MFAQKKQWKGSKLPFILMQNSPIRFSISPSIVHIFCVEKQKTSVRLTTGKELYIKSHKYITTALIIAGFRKFWGSFNRIQKHSLEGREGTPVRVVRMHEHGNVNLEIVYFPPHCLVWESELMRCLSTQGRDQFHCLKGSSHLVWCFPNVACIGMFVWFPTHISCLPHCV